MKLKMLSKIAVEKTGASNAQDNGGFFKVPENLDNCGRIRFIDESLQTKDLFPGATVYFGVQYEEVQIRGVKLLIMDVKNVYATVTDEEGKA